MAMLGLKSRLPGIAFLIAATILLGELYVLCELSLPYDRPGNSQYRSLLQEWAERRRRPAAKVDPVTRTAAEFRDLFDSFAATWFPAPDHSGRGRLFSYIASTRSARGSGD
jgi:hypothetical protein